MAVSTRCPKLDPKPGDCLVKDGANYRPLFRYVVWRVGLDIKYVSSETSAVKNIWLPSWQEWAACVDTLQNADIEKLEPHELFELARSNERRTRAEPD